MAIKIQYHTLRYYELKKDMELRDKKLMLIIILEGRVIKFYNFSISLITILSSKFSP